MPCTAIPLDQSKTASQISRKTARRACYCFCIRASCMWREKGTACVPPPSTPFSQMNSSLSSLSSQDLFLDPDAFRLHHFLQTVDPVVIPAHYTSVGARSRDSGRHGVGLVAVKVDTSFQGGHAPRAQDSFRDVCREVGKVLPTHTRHSKTSWRAPAYGAVWMSR